MEHLRQIAGDRRTLIFYEAPHKLVYTLQDMLQVLGDRRIALCRELTKLHEEIIRTTFSSALALYREKSPRGEYVLIIEGAPEPEKTSLTLEDAAAQVKKLREPAFPFPTLQNKWQKRPDTKRAICTGWH